MPVLLRSGWCRVQSGDGSVVRVQRLAGQRHVRLAERLVRAAPLAARATKEVAVRSQHLTTIDAIRFGETMRRVAGATDDAAEGGRAFREQRAPRWTGR